MLSQHSLDIIIILLINDHLMITFSLNLLQQKDWDVYVEHEG